MVEIRDGERIGGEDRLDVSLLADLEEIGVAEVRARPAAGADPPAHVHRRHAEALYVLDGELVLRLEDGERRVGADTWAFIPPGVGHAYTVAGGERARFLELHLPSCGFGDFLRRRAAHPAFDQEPMPEHGGADPSRAVIVRGGGGEGETIRDQPGRRATVLVDTEELTLSEFLYGPGERGANLHVHHHHADGFLVVGGEITLGYRDGTLTAPAGTLVLLPPGVVHGFDNDGADRMRVFNLHMPASGFADYLRGRNPEFDQHDPPADGGVDPSAIVAVRLSD